MLPTKLPGSCDISMVTSDYATIRAWSAHGTLTIRL